MTTDYLMQYIPISPGRISLKDLSAVIGHPKSITKRIIKDMRIEGEIIASDSNGYYIPASVDELIRYYRASRKRAMTALRSVKAVRRMLIESGIDIASIEGRKRGTEEE